MTTQIEKTKNCAGFKVADSELIWRADEYKNNGVVGICEGIDDGEKNLFVTSRFFTEEDLKSAVFYKFRSEKKKKM